jgi:hypothetical protein
MQDDDAARAWVWDLPDGGRSNDADALRSGWQGLVDAGGWRTETLGCVGDDPLLLLERPARDPASPRLLLAAAHLTLLPLVNPTGFRAGRRFNDWGENPNRGFGRHAGGIAASREGRRLMAHAARLAAAGRDGVLSCHEDVKQTRFGYLYSLERLDSPGPFSQALLAANAQHFPVHPDGEVDGCPIQGGIVFNRHDGSFEAWAMELGALRAACVETPGQADIARRIAAQAAMADAFFRFAVTLQTSGGSA